MTRPQMQPAQFWQNKLTGVVIQCSGAFTPSGPEWHLAYRRVRMLRHIYSGEVIMEEYDDYCSALDDPHVKEMTFSEYQEWKTLNDNRDL